jgi:mRNA interferase MazF
MICDHWDVALVPFPFMEIPVSKKRPALVISSKDFNSKNQHSVFAMITTAKASSWPSDYLLLAPEKTGLRVNCYVRWKTFTLPNQMIVGRMGRLSDLDEEQLKIQAKAIFAFA